MTTQQWAIIIGVIVSGLLALGPWMFMVHAKLAVLAEHGPLQHHTLLDDRPDE